ncbi:MAG: aminotransferase class I/II-fold pyridoxal phosphate-dependent enzyme [Vicinamibacterales bacterium]
MFPQPQLRWLDDAMAAVSDLHLDQRPDPVRRHHGLRGGTTIERYLWRARRILESLARTCAGRLRQAGLGVPEPAGAFYLFPDFSPVREELRRRGIETSAQLADRLLTECGVAGLPGSDFNREPGDLQMRFSLVDFDGAKAMAALETMPPDQPVDEPFVATHCRGVIEGLQRVATWVAEGAV